MHTLIFTGNAGVGIAHAAALTAAHAAAQGKRTLLASIGPAHSVGALVGVEAAREPQALGPNLDLWMLDALGDMSALWAELAAASTGSVPPIGGDELPLIPGSDLFLGVQRLRRFASRGYDLICIDAGPQDAVLRALSIPDGARWLTRLLIGLDREPGRSSASLARALVPTTFIPYEWLNQVQTARVTFEQLRDEMLDPQRTRVRYVLRPDRGGLQEARLALPALQLFGLAVEQVVAGPVLPPAAAQIGLTELVQEQQQVIAEATPIWSPRPLLQLGALATPGSIAGLAGLGAQLYAQAPLLPIAPEAPLSFGEAADPYVSISLPGLQREALGLSMSGDELIVHVGPYRRHILLPTGLRGVQNIRAARQGDALIIRPRT